MVYNANRPVTVVAVGNPVTGQVHVAPVGGQTATVSQAAPMAPSGPMKAVLYVSRVHPGSNFVRALL